MVNDLINPVTKYRDEELISSLFWLVDANRIMEIPIAPHGYGRMEDFVAWYRSDDGIFSIRSAYHAEWDYEFGRKEREFWG
jgi:hypothetical protein